MGVCKLNKISIVTPVFNEEDNAEANYEVCLGVKTDTTYKNWFFKIPKLYDKVLNRLSNTMLIEKTTAFGIFSKLVLNQIQAIKEPYSYLRGLVSDLGFDIATINYEQNARKRGVSSILCIQ